MTKSVSPLSLSFAWRHPVALLRGVVVWCGVVTQTFLSFAQRCSVLYCIALHRNESYGVLSFRRR